LANWASVFEVRLFGIVPRASIAACVALASGCSAQRPEPKQRALLFVDKANYAAAERVLLDHLASHPTALAERRLLIRVLAFAGQLGRAEAQAKILAQQLGSQSPLPWIELGHALELSHRYDEALVMYDRAAEVAPSDPVGPRTGGLRAAHWDEPELAEPRLSEALRRRSTDAEVWHALGLVRLKLKDFSGAETAYRSGLQADPRALENRIGLATIAVVQRDAARALVEYDAILAARPSFTDAYLGRAWALMKLGRLDDAERSLETAQKRGANARAIAEQRRLLGVLRQSRERTESN
jgi:tetratricopeptide (TPR) repeat protein